MIEIGVVVSRQLDEAFYIFDHDAVLPQRHQTSLTQLPQHAIEMNWGDAERVSTGLMATSIDLQPEGREMLATADAVTP